MRKLIVIVLCLCCTAGLSAQDIAGDWSGLLQIPDGQMRIVVHITKTEKGYAATVDSPDDGRQGIVVKTITFDNNTLWLDIPEEKLVYTGVLGKNGVIKGGVRQEGQVIPLNLSKEKVLGEVSD